MMLTGDLNVAIVEWIVQYRIRIRTRYLFKVRDPKARFATMNEAVMRQVVGDRTVDGSAHRRPAGDRDPVETELQAMAKQYSSG